MGPGLLVSESQFRKEKKKKMVTGSEFIRPKVEWAIREDTSLGLLISESPLEKGREKNEVTGSEFIKPRVEWAV